MHKKSQAFLLGLSGKKIGRLANLSLARKKSSFFHGERLGLDVTFEFRLGLQLTTIRADSAFHLTIHLNFTSLNITFDFGIFADGDAALFRLNLTINFTVDDHIVGKLN